MTDHAAPQQPTADSLQPAAAGAAAAGTFMLGGQQPVRRLGFGDRHLARAPGAAGPLLRRARELGVNFIDAHGIPGLFVADQLLAETLAPYPDELVLVSALK